MDDAIQHRLPDRGRLAGVAWKAPAGFAAGMPQCRLLQRGRRASPDEFVIFAVPLVFHGE
jgi:hypothetical protein